MPTLQPNRTNWICITFAKHGGINACIPGIVITENYWTHVKHGAKQSLSKLYLQYSELHLEYSELKLEYSELKLEYSDLNFEYSELKLEYN